MKITSKIFHIPPYISTSWNQIRTLYLKGSNLVICLNAGTNIEIPNLDTETLNTIFNTHAMSLEGNQIGNQDPSQSLQLSHSVIPNQAVHVAKKPTESDGDPSLSFVLGTPDSMGSVLHHNPSQAGMPDLPKEILYKISAIAKIIAPEDIQTLPKPEPHCNCMHCQIAKAMRHTLDEENENFNMNTFVEVEEVKDSDLLFQQWDIAQVGENLFSVTNRLDSLEKYSVYLGHPVGCTCGNEGCEHILAVLKS